MNQSTINSAKSKFDVFYEKLDKIYSRAIVLILWITLLLITLLLIKEFL